MAIAYLNTPHYADLMDAQYHNANLSHAEFLDARLWRAQFPNADLSEAQFPDADLRDAQFPDADLLEAQFPDADLWDAEFPDANLLRAQFPRADLKRAEFPDADLPHAQFPDAFLFFTQFLTVDLRSAESPGANLRAARFNDSDLEGADLSGTNLFGANLRRTGLYGATFDDVSINRRTTFGAHYISRSLRGVVGRLSRVWTIGHEFRLALAPARTDYTDEGRLGMAAAEGRSGMAAWSFRKVELLSQNAGLSKQARSYNVQRKDIERWLYLVEDGSRWRWALAMLSSLTMRYGRSPWRVVGLSVVAIVAAAVGYMWQGLRLTGGGTSQVIDDGAGSVPLPTLVGKNLYFSTITFTTVGYGDIQPVGWSQTIATVESFLGALLMALLVYVLGRRATW